MKTNLDAIKREAPKLSAEMWRRGLFTPRTQEEAEADKRMVSKLIKPTTPSARARWRQKLRATHPGYQKQWRAKRKAAGLPYQ